MRMVDLVDTQAFFIVWVIFGILTPSSAMVKKE